MSLSPFDQIIWDETNVDHIAELGVTPDEVEDVLRKRRNPIYRRRSDGRFQTFGWTEAGQHILVIWEEINDDPRMVYPVTANPVKPSTRGPT
jgi:hypothetical protein